MAATAAAADKGSNIENRCIQNKTEVSWDMTQKA